jgi:phosphoribosylanthranilate isomerase
VQVKICGITNLEDARYCIECGADALGFIFYKKSPRFVSPNTVAEINTHLPPFKTTVGVFVDHSFDEIMNIVHMTGISTVQLHGLESPEFAKALPIRTIKAFRVSDGFDFNILIQYNNCDILLDTYHKTQHGGTGKTFNWDIIPEKYRQDIILAGGITPSNVTEVYKKIHPKAVDLSSALEKKPGIKDKDKVCQFFNIIKELKRKS